MVVGQQGVAFIEPEQLCHSLFVERDNGDAVYGAVGVLSSHAQESHRSLSLINFACYMVVGYYYLSFWNVVIIGVMAFSLMLLMRLSGII